mgnify:CR=1 FL=1
MGEIISIGDSLFISLFSIIVVFIILIAISYLIDLLRIISSAEKDQQAPVVDSAMGIKPEIRTVDEELVAVISAALASSLGKTVPEINIKSIKKL